MFNGPENEEPDFTYGQDSKGSNNQAKPSTEAPKEDVRLYPVQKDPSCKPDWILAAYWPVYVGNFKMEVWEEETWYDQVANYFAYYGLLTRMVVFHRHRPLEQFRIYQNNCHILDMLVYFTSKEDAERAIATCHGDNYYGYKINVLPGRTPVYFDNPRSVRFIEIANHYPVEWRMEVAFSEQEPVDFIGRYPENDVIVEFASIEAMLAAIASQIKWKPTTMEALTMKQRFLEGDAVMDIEWAAQSNPAFMDQKPQPDVLQRLFEGARPNVSTAWQGHRKFAYAPLFRKNRLKEKRRTQSLMAKHRNRFRKPKTEIVSRDAPRAMTPTEWRRRKEADVFQTTNRLLRQYGRAPLSRDSFE